MAKNIYDAMSGEWLEVEDVHPPLSNHDPYWGPMLVGLVVLSWACAVGGVIAVISRGVWW